MITIGITAYREGTWLQECWNSVLSQTFKDWEAILVLDGGADVKTKTIFDSIAHPRLKKIQMPENKGPYPCREAIFEESTYDVILYIDADDFFAPDAAAKVVDLFADPTVAYAGVGAELFWEDGTRKYIPGHPTTIEKLIRNFEFPGYLVFRKSTWINLGKYEPMLKRGKADFDFCLKILEKNLKGKFLQDVLIYKRERNRSVCRSYNHRMGRVHEIIVSNHPLIFNDDSIRRYFLNLGYMTS
ncbi:glycosyltransferase, partial [Candidatus Thiomargarita nelsonii]